MSHRLQKSMFRMDVELDVKSNNSYKAGVELIGKGFYTSSIHCLYYSVLQFMKYKLAHCSVKPLTYEEQQSKIDLNKCSTHEWLYDEICVKLSKRPKSGFQDDFKFLKKNRIEADYSTRNFSQDDSADCRDKTDRIFGYLRYIK